MRSSRDKGEDPTEPSGDVERFQVLGEDLRSVIGPGSPTSHLDRSGPGYPGPVEWDIYARHKWDIYSRRRHSMGLLLLGLWDTCLR